MAAQVVCQGCGRLFQAARTDRIWCDECRVQQAKNKYGRYESRHKVPCPDCGQPMGRGASYCLPCSNKHRGEKRRAENNGYWKGGTTVSTDGYTYVRVAHCSGAGAYRGRHHLVWEKANNRPIPNGWVVHHLNGVKDDNRLENLVALSPKDHHTQHEAYRERIRALERELRELRGE